MRINLGSGPDVRSGWWNCDVDPYPGLDWQGDILAGVPLADGCADAVFAGHVLQMIARPDLGRFLAEARRLLAPGGVLRVVVPDVAKAFWAWVEQDRSWFPIASELAPTTDDALCLYVTQAGATRSVFTPGHLERLVRGVGFRQVRFASAGVTCFGEDWIVELDSRAGESLFVEATK